MVSRHACLDNILALESVTGNDHPTWMPSHDRPATRLPVARYHYAPFHRKYLLYLPTLNSHGETPWLRVMDMQILDPCFSQHPPRNLL
jgi:hypothetical protein